MSLQLPRQLTVAMSMTGYEWPAVNEDRLGTSGWHWVSLGGTLHQHHTDAGDAAGRVFARNDGADVAAMRESMAVSAEDGGDHARVALLIGGACVVGGALVLAWKVGIIAALVRLAVRIARALSASAVSMGASLASLPMSVLVTRVAMRQTLRRIVGMLKRLVVAPFEKAAELLARSKARLGVKPDPLRAAANRSVNVRAITPKPIYRSDRLILRRADDRAPDEVFGPGFHPRNPANTDLESHLRFEESAFVSTTRLDNPMDIFPTKYLYDVDAPGGIDLEKTMGSALRTAHQREVAFPGGIEGRFIRGARPYDPETGQFGEYIANPHFRP